MLDFVDNVPLPTANTVHVSVSSVSLQALQYESQGDPLYTASQLAVVKATLVAAEMNAANRPIPAANKAAAKMAMLEVDKCVYIFLAHLFQSMLSILFQESNFFKVHKTKCRAYKKL